MPATSDVHREARARALRWLALATSSLLLAGFLASSLVVGRLPILREVVPDPGFFKRCLVVHVDLSLLVWFQAFVAALFTLVPTRTRSNPIARGAPFVAGAGTLAMIASAGFASARPVLANYVPLLDHALFRGGLLLFAFAMAATVLDARLLPRTETRASGVPLPPDAIAWMRASGVAVLLALVTFATSALETRADLGEARWELVMWGGGHVLQFANVAAMLAVWAMLLASTTGVVATPRKLAALLSFALVSPLFVAPLLAIAGPTTATYHSGFTRLMQFAIAPPVLVQLVITARAFVRARREGRLPERPLHDERLTGLAASAVLTVVGFAIGALVRGPNTTVPAHYHASIGAVTVAFMAIAPTLLVALGLRRPAGLLARVLPLQPLLLGGGQTVFAIGFAMAGAHGMQRKAYGSEQQVRTTLESIGLGVMGIGGLLAVAGGALFLITVLAMARPRLVELFAKRGHAWRTPNLKAASPRSGA